LQPLQENLNDLAFTDLTQDELINIDEDAQKAHKIMQFGLQYLLHTQNVIIKKTEKIQ